MKRTFKLTHPKIKVARLFETVRCDVKKYIKKERTKKLPDGCHYWDFDCKYGTSAEDCKEIHMAEISKYINDAEEQKLESIYLEVIAKPARRNAKPVVEEKPGV